MSCGPVEYMDEVRYFVSQMAKDERLSDDNSTDLVRAIERAIERIGIPDPELVLDNSPSYDGSVSVDDIPDGVDKGKFVLRAAKLVFVHDVLGYIQLGLYGGKESA